MTLTNIDVPSMPIDTISGFTYLIRSAPALALPVDGLTMFGGAQDMECGVLHLISASHARYCYIPVQAIPQGMTTPDLVVDVANGEQILTTLHFCTIWRGMQRDRHPETWERVSFPKRQQAFLYNDIRLQLCRACHHLHKYACLLDERQANGSLVQALAAHGLAVCVSGGYVYLVAWSEDSPLFGGLPHGAIYQYAIWSTLGLQEYPKYEFVRMSSCAQYLTEQGISLKAGWQGASTFLQSGDPAPYEKL